MGKIKFNFIKQIISQDLNYLGENYIILVEMMHLPPPLTKDEEEELVDKLDNGDERVRSYS